MARRTLRNGQVSCLRPNVSRTAVEGNRGYIIHGLLAFPRTRNISLARAGLKDRGAQGNFHWRTPTTYFMTSSFVNYVFADSQRSRLLFPIVDYAPAAGADLPLG